MKNARFEPFELVTNGFGFVGKVFSRYYDAGRLTYLVKDIGTGKFRSFGEKQIHRATASA